MVPDIDAGPPRKEGRQIVIKVTSQTNNYNSSPNLLRKENRVHRRDYTDTFWQLKRRRKQQSDHVGA